MQIYKFRDLTIINELDKETVIACDSCCGIGERELDIIKSDNKIVGYFSARVCLFELLAFKARPQVIVNNLGMPMKGQGERIIEGINKAIEEYNNTDFFNDKYDLKECVTGSTEDNFNTLQTFLGLTIVGKKSKEKKKNFEKGDAVVLLGIPKVGIEVLEELKSEKREIVGFKELKLLSEFEGVKEILPIGSKGAIHEVKELEVSNKIKIEIKYDSEKLRKSAGPATALLFMCSNESIEEIKNKIYIPMIKIGEVI